MCFSVSRQTYPFLSRVHFSLAVFPFAFSLGGKFVSLLFWSLNSITAAETVIKAGAALWRRKTKTPFWIIDLSLFSFTFFIIFGKGCYRFLCPKKYREFCSHCSHDCCSTHAQVKLSKVLLQGHKTCMVNWSEPQVAFWWVLLIFLGALELPVDLLYMHNRPLFQISFFLVFQRCHPNQVLKFPLCCLGNQSCIQSWGLA